MDAQMDRQLRTYGEYSEMITPYTERGIQARMETPEGRRLNQVVDPFHYRARLTQPKLVLLGSNDPYWTADAAQLYFNDLRGPSALFYLPNAGHGLGLGVLPTLNAFIDSAINGSTLPKVTAQQNGGSLEVNWDRPGQPSLWSARSPNRDFRESTWEESPLEGDGRCSVELKAPDDGGWLAAFVSVAFGNGSGTYSLSTPIAVVPDTFPHRGRGE
jgi:PhoPQ-activated pathogenicity-related protein